MVLELREQDLDVSPKDQVTVSTGSAITLLNTVVLRSVLALRISLIARVKPTHHTVPSTRAESRSHIGT